MLDNKTTVAAILLGFLTLLFFSTAHADAPAIRLEIPSSPNPVGSGARALGMGGAFIAVADDATAASWNPGGLIQLEKPELSIVFGGFHREEDNHFRGNPGASGAETVGDENLNYLSVALPFQVFRRNMVVSLNYQHLYNFNRDWAFEFRDPDPIFSGPIQYDYVQKGDLYAMGLALAAEILPNLSLGATLNYWGDFIRQNEWEQRYKEFSPIAFGNLSGAGIMTKTEQYAFEGWNANIGMRWRVGNRWSFGAVFKTPFEADIDHTIRTAQIVRYDADPMVEQRVDTTLEFDETLSMPLSYGLGVSYRFTDAFLLSADIYRTHWEDFELEDADGNTTSPVTGKPSKTSGIDPTTWVRLGGEYLFIGDNWVIPLRAGVFYDPAPAEDSPDDYYGFSIGSGFVHKRFTVDAAYQFRYGDDVGDSSLQSMGFSQDVCEHTVFTSIIVYF